MSRQEREHTKQGVSREDESLSVGTLLYLDVENVACDYLGCFRYQKIGSLKTLCLVFQILIFLNKFCEGCTLLL